MDEIIRSGEIVNAHARRRVGVIPAPVTLFAFFAAIAHIVLCHARYWRQIYAMGGNPEAQG